jgi:formylglycine-generating enzyme required for sulfatase activity
MLSVPGGTFWMGSPAGEGDMREQPAHQVTVSGFCIDQTEVTVEAYGRCVRGGPCRPAPTPYEYSNLAMFVEFCNAGRSGRDSHPVNCVDWNQANTYCKWSGGRLPTEAEWEYAARGTDGRRYPWGSEAPGPRLLNACGSECVESKRKSGDKAMFEGTDGYETTAPVGSYPTNASPFGALDMAGNLAEWTSDWYGPYSADSANNPTGPASGKTRVSRGGSWYSNDPGSVRAANRDWGAPWFRSDWRGFRCARGARTAGP